MSNDYTYRDPRLSLWQSAASVTQSKRSLEAGNKVIETPSGAESKNPFMVPVHAVARTIEDAGKPLESLIDDVKKGIFDLEALFRPLEDCARAAARFLWAEVTGNEKESKIYAAELEKSECDALGWAECLTAYLGYKLLLKNPIYRPGKGAVANLKPDATIAIIGDWGTGTDVATNLLKQVAAQKPDILLHLGDIYYAGTDEEARNNVLAITRSILSDTPLYSLCGNHDMYAGGSGYYWLLDQTGQEASYFCLQNDDWLFLAMDTGFHDSNPLNIATNLTRLVTEGSWSEAAWHQEKIAQRGDRKLVLLSHHQLFSPFGSVGSVNGIDLAYNENLLGDFGPVLPDVEWWFWGHEHTLGVFPPYMDLKRGRCVGASAVPVFQDQQSYSTAANLRTLSGLPMPTWDKDMQLGTTDDMYNNCFAIMRLKGSGATVDYYEVPLLKEARKFDKSDVA